MLETLKDVSHVGGFKLIEMDTIRDTHPELFDASGAMNWEIFERDIRPNHFIYVRHDKNSLSFTLQDGPVKEKGVNGCQVDTLIEAAKTMLIGLDSKFPCEDNKNAIAHLFSALACLEQRTLDREARGVEGTANA